MRVFTQQKGLRRPTFYFTQPQTPQRPLLLLATSRKQIETTSIFTNSTNQSCDTFNKMLAALRNVAACCVALRKCGMLENVHEVYLFE